MKRSNPYESLRIDCLCDAEPVEAQSLCEIGCPDELISISTAVMPDGRWVYGYTVNWHIRDGQAKQQVSHSAPTPSLGLFASQREARLYAVGFMLSYVEYFLPETVDALRREEGHLRQMQLF